jgi:glycosyltransferase involved in cell wall biosynthesis
VQNVVVAIAENPMISILLPVFNAERTLAPCLRSIRRQSEKSWECILVDDGSQDGSLELARARAGGDVRFRFTAHPHRGLVPTLNSGLGLCRGTYIARMDADDIMHRHRLREQLALMRADESLAAAGCHVRIFPRRRPGAGTLAYERWLNGIDSPRRVREEAFVECPVCHPTLIVRRDQMLRLRYRDRGWPEDYDLLLRLITEGKRVGMLARRRHLWRSRSGRLSTTSAVYGHNRFTECKAAFLASSFLSAGKSYILWGYGKTGRRMRTALQRTGKRPSHIVEVHPGRLGNLIHGAPVIPPERLTGLPRRPILVSVAGAGPRSEIRRWLESAGFTELRDYVCVA